MSALESLSLRVADDVDAGKSLHADEQSPAFLYNDVSALEREWKGVEESAGTEYERVKVRVWFDLLALFKWVLKADLVLFRANNFVK